MGDFFPCSSSSQNCPALYFVHQYTLLHIMHCFGAQVFQNPPFHTALNYRSNKIYSSNTNGISVKNYSYTAVYTVLFYLNNNIVAGENVRASRKKSGNQRLANLPTIINMCNPPQHCYVVIFNYMENSNKLYKHCSYIPTSKKIRIRAKKCAKSKTVKSAKPTAGGNLPVLHTSLFNQSSA